MRKVCVTCLNGFETEYPTTLYCGLACKEKAYRGRRKSSTKASQRIVQIKNAHKQGWTTEELVDMETKQPGALKAFTPGMLEVKRETLPRQEGESYWDWLKRKAAGGG